MKPSWVGFGVQTKLLKAHIHSAWSLTPCASLDNLNPKHPSSYYVKPP